MVTGGAEGVKSPLTGAGQVHLRQARLSGERGILMKSMKGLIIALAIGILIAGMAGCSEGPLEEAGKKIDKTVEDIKK